MKISIVLPVYNGEDYLEESLNSIIRQSYKNFEIIIVDDCSTDSTAAIALRYSKQFDNICYFKNDVNLKLPATLNRGFTFATGEYWTWTSCDNLYSPNALEKMAFELDSNPDVGFVYAGMTVFNDKTSIVNPLIVGPAEELIFRNVVGACFLYRANIAKQIGVYNEKMFLCEDYEYWLRFGLAAKMKPINENLYFYRSHEKSLSHKYHEKVIAKCIEVQKLYYSRYISTRTKAATFYLYLRAKDIFNPWRQLYLLLAFYYNPWTCLMGLYKIIHTRLLKVVDKPIVFFPVENTPRELDYKLNLARHFLKAGCDVIIGNPPFIRDELKYKNYCGLFLEKGTNPDAAYYNSLKKKNILLYCLSDEGAAYPAFSVTYKPAVDALKTMETIFLWGNFQKQDLIERNADKDLNDKYYVSGYPGFEFSLPIYKRYNQSLKPKFLPKEYILVNTNFSMYNGFNLNENRKACTTMSPETMSTIAEMERHEAQTFTRFYAWLVEIIKSLPDQQFLIRPHPCEKKERYDEFFKEFANVTVSKSGTVNQVISSAKLVLHRDCTTALQSFLMGVPVISLVYSSYEHIHSPWSLGFSATPNTIEEAKTIINQVISEGDFTAELKAKIKTSAETNLAERFYNIGNSSKTVLSIMKKAINERWQNFVPYQVIDSRTYIQKIKHFVRSFMPLHYKVPKASRGSLLPFSVDDLKTRLSLMQEVDGLIISCKIRKIFPNAFYITAGEMK